MREMTQKILEALSDGQPAKIRVVKSRLVAAGETQDRVAKMGGYEFTALTRAKLINRPERGVYQITEKGQGVLTRVSGAANQTL